MSSQITSIEFKRVSETPHIDNIQEANTLELPPKILFLDKRTTELVDIPDNEEIDGIMMIEYIQLKKFLEPLITYAGLFAGFEAFIINSYTDNNALNENISNGLFCMYLSFCANLMVVITTLIISLSMSRGNLTFCFKLLINLCCVGGVIAGIVFFGIAIMFYVWATSLSDAMKITIWVFLSGIGLLTLGIFIYQSIKLSALEIGRKMSLARRLL